MSSLKYMSSIGKAQFAPGVLNGGGVPLKYPSLATKSIIKHLSSVTQHRKLRDAWVKGSGRLTDIVIAARVVDPEALFTPPIGCPCTPKLLCETDKRGIMNKDCQFPGNMNTPWADVLYSTDGGSGVLLSVGLMQALDLEEVESCVANTSGSASDHIFTFCMWQLGYVACKLGPE